MLRSISKKHGRVGSPGIFEMSPQITTTNPAPAEMKMSFTTTLKPVGAPLTVGSAVNEFDVFAMQTGSLLNPFQSEKKTKRIIEMNSPLTDASLMLIIYLRIIHLDFLLDDGLEFNFAGSVHLFCNY